MADDALQRRLAWAGAWLGLGYLVSDAVTDLDAPILTQERHRFAIGHAREEVAEFLERWRMGDVPAPVAAVHLHDAVAALEELIGAVDVEHVLDEVFRRFCVGK